MKNIVLMRSINTLYYMYFRQNNSLILKLTSGKRKSIVFNCHKLSFFSFVNRLLTALKQNEQITNRFPRQHIQRYISDRS
jgi:hypothetical protein